MARYMLPNAALYQTEPRLDIDKTKALDSLLIIYIKEWKVNIFSKNHAIILFVRSFALENTAYIW